MPINKVKTTEETPETEPVDNKEAQWANIETEVSRVKEEFLAGNVTLDEAIDEIITNLESLKSKPELGGLGNQTPMTLPEEEENV